MIIEMISHLERKKAEIRARQNKQRFPQWDWDNNEKLPHECEYRKVTTVVGTFIRCIHCSEFPLKNKK